MTIAIVSAANFTPYVGENLTLTGQDSVVDAMLAKVVEYPASTAPGSVRTAFSLFLCVQHHAFPEVQSGNYLIEHRGLEAIGPVYMERVFSGQPGEIRLEAAFN
jgi:hypothetical protein